MDDDLPPAPAWMHDALCLEYPEVNFFPGRGGNASARAICARCLVSAECGDFAHANGYRSGIWGQRQTPVR